MNNQDGQAWPAAGSLVFVLDVVETYIQGDHGDEIASSDYFAAKLSEHEELRASNPRESFITKRNRQEVLDGATLRGDASENRTRSATNE